jgi:hypothetical protein
MLPVWIAIVGIVALILRSVPGPYNPFNGMIGASTLPLGIGSKPVLWWVVDDSQRNARNWEDWGARTTNAPNEPYLQICLKKANEMWGDMFHIVPLFGRAEVLLYFYEKQMAESQFQKSQMYSVPIHIDRVPPALWLPWCRAKFLHTMGGLWMDGSVLPTGTGIELFKRVQLADVLTFGTDPDEGLSSSEASAPAAGRSAGWSSIPGHPMWSGLERDISALISEGSQSWGSVEVRRALRTLWDKHCVGVTKIDRDAEISRDMYGRRLELDTLLGTTDWPTGSTKGGLWVPFPDGRDSIERSSPYAWFSRMSEKQIAESRFLWAEWAKNPPR